MLPETLETIGWSAFSDTSVTNLRIPEKVTSIGNNAFSTTRVFPKIFFTGDAPSFGVSTFSGTVGTVYYPTNNPTWTEDVRQLYDARQLSWVAYEPLRIETQPKSAAVAEGEKITVSVEVVGEGLTYQWYWAAAGSSNFVEHSGFTTNSYAVWLTPARAGRQVYCVITDKYGNTVKTDTVTLNIGMPLKIVNQPKNATVKEGEKASVSVEAVGEGLTYQWYWAAAGSSNFVPHGGFTTNSYAVWMTSARAGRQVYCVITDKYGNSVTTNTVSLYMGEPVAIDTQPESVTVAEGVKATVTVKAVGDGLTYQWYWAAAGSSNFVPHEGFTTNSYGVWMNASRNGRQVYCVITDQYGNTVQTNTVTLNME